MNYIEIINNYNGDLPILEDMKKFIIYCTSKLELDNVLFNIIIVGNDDIHALNNEYRGIDKPTDVISFALEDEKTNFKQEVRVLGDIYISYDKVIEQAKEYGHSELREICFLAIHGLLHLLGYDHINKEDETKMFKLQKELLESYGIKKEG